MYYSNVTIQDGKLEINDVPNAAKVIALKDLKSKRLSDYALHESDLRFAEEALDRLINTPEDDIFMREALWRTAITHFVKCFGSDARSTLSERKVYKSEPPVSLVVFAYFKHLRNKHVTHDENAYSRSIPVAVINDGTYDHKIEEVKCLKIIANTIHVDSIKNLSLLTTKALDWLSVAYDRITAEIQADLEALSYEHLSSMPTPTYKVPTVDEVGKSRLI